MTIMASTLIRLLIQTVAEEQKDLPVYLSTKELGTNVVRVKYVELGESADRKMGIILSEEAKLCPGCPKCDSGQRH